MVVQPLICLVASRYHLHAPRSDAPALKLVAVASYNLVSRIPGTVVAIGALLTALFAIAFAHVPADYRIRESLNLDHPVNVALGDIDRELAGLFNIKFAVPLPTAGEPLERGNLEFAGRLHDTLQDINGTGKVSSIWDFAKWLGDGSVPDPARMETLWQRMDPEQQNRLVSRDGNEFMLSAHIGETPAREAVSEADRMLTALRAVAGTASIVADGLMVYASSRSLQIIADLKTGLLIAVFLAIVLIAIAFRSMRLGVMSLAPNVLPILATGTFLWLQGQPLQFSSALALTIAFGIAVNDSIHLLNRYRLEQVFGFDNNETVHRALISTGPVMAATTIILCAGLFSSLTSSLPTVVMFGSLCMILLSTALIADLLLLPAILLVFPSYRVRKASAA